MILRLRYALRTLLGPWLVLLALGVEVTTFLVRGMPWRGEGMWTVEWFAIGLFIIGPLCAGVAAVDAARLSRPGNIHLVVSVPRPALAYLRAAAWCAGPIIGMHILVIATAVVVGNVHQPSVGWWAMLSAALVQCAAVVWYVAVGSAIGRFVPPLLAGLVGGGAGFALQYVASDALTGAPAFRLLDLGAATVSRIGWTYNAGYLAAQAATFTATFLLFILLPVRTRSGRNIPSPGAALPAVLAVATILAGPTVFPSKRVVDDARPPDLCFGTRPQVCVYYEHRRFAPLVLPKVEALAKAALEAGYPAFIPALVMEDSRTQRASGPGVMTLSLPAWTYEEERLPIEDVAASLLMPTHCAQLYTPVPPPKEFADRYFALLATWLRLVGKDLDQAPVQARILRPQEVEEILVDFARCGLGGRP